MAAKLIYVVSSTFTYDHDPSQSKQACTSIAGASFTKAGVELIIKGKDPEAQINWTNADKTARAYSRQHDTEYEVEQVEVTTVLHRRTLSRKTLAKTTRRLSKQTQGKD